MKQRLGTRAMFVLAMLVACVLAVGTSIALAAEVDSSMGGNKSLTVNPAPSSSPDDGHDEALRNAVPQVNVYLIASGTYLDQYDTYEYKLDPAYKDLESTFSKVSAIKSSTNNTAGQSSDTEEPTWADLADDAGKIVSKSGGTIKPVTGGPVAAGTKIMNLQDGLYLVLIDPAQGNRYTYTFTPAIIAVPNKESDGKTVADTTVPGVWTVDVIANVKWEPTPNKGSLTINKSVTGYSGEPASFVYHIVGTDAEGKVQFEARRLVHVGADEVTNGASVTVGRIPLGLKITVWEEYPGASYRQVIDAAQGLTNPVVIDSGVVADGEGVTPVSVRFVNEPNDSGKGGHGIENHFVFDKTLNGGDWRSPTVNAVVGDTVDGAKVTPSKPVSE